jgi:hypothetical protein
VPKLRRGGRQRLQKYGPRARQFYWLRKGRFQTFPSAPVCYNPRFGHSAKCVQAGNFIEAKERNHPMNSRAIGISLFVAGLGLTAPALAEMSAEELAKLAQNPVGNLISLPFQNNTNLNFGPEKGTQNILNIQPVYPISVNSEWNVITRTIVPVVWNPALGPTTDSTNGIGDTVFTAFLSPANPGEWIWGVGPVFQLPTNSAAELGNRNWGMGPSAVVLHLEKGSPWVYGVLVNNIWSLTSDKQGGAYNNGLVQPFVNYNFEGGLYLTTAPILTVNWKAENSQQWTVPLGGGVGKIFHLGKLPVNTQISAYYNVVRPDFGANWQIRAQVQLMFPK